MTLGLMILFSRALDDTNNRSPTEASAQLATRMITVLNKYIYQFTNKRFIKTN